MSGRVPPKCPKNYKDRYTVKPGDTMFKIAQKFNLNMQDLINANPHISDPDKIYPGDVLCVPVLLKILTTGPLAVDPEQTGVGVIVQNNTPRTLKVRLFLIDKTTCPKRIFRAIKLNIRPGCLFIEAFPVWASVYEVQVQEVSGILVSVYGLGFEFKVIAGNTLRHSELVELETSTVDLIRGMEYEDVSISNAASGWQSSQK